MTKKVSELKTDKIKEAVRKAYTDVAEGQSNQETTAGCCGAPASQPARAKTSLPVSEER